MNKPPTPRDFRRRPLHIALVLTDVLGRIPPLLLTFTWLALAVIASWSWIAAAPSGTGASLAPTVAVMSLAFILADWATLALLPRLGRSFGPITPPMLGLALVRTGITLAVGWLWVRAGAALAAAPPGARASLVPAGLVVDAALQLAITALVIYATWIEPFRISVTQDTLRSPKLAGSTPLRLLHLSDLHVERITPRERDLLRLVEELALDVIVITGDYLNLSSVYDPQAQAAARDLLARLCETTRVPIYAITGSPPVDRTDVVPGIFRGLPIIWLLDEVAEAHVNGHSLRLVGLHCTRDRSIDGPRLRRLLESQDETPFTVLLYHSPDLMPEAVELGVDLYLCGHTHGGQVRLPLFGALITSSDFGKRYEMGRYREGGTTLYVSRGLGMEGLGAPRARFLAPPEVVLWTCLADKSFGTQINAAQR
jgi:predicted MPP superfamily phosphohydrolase